MRPKTFGRTLNNIISSDLKSYVQTMIFIIATIVITNHCTLPSCDPPYGIRAGARKTGSRIDKPRPIPEEHRHDHTPKTKPYAVSDVMSDLLDMAARTLVISGRLVYVIPSFAVLIHQQIFQDTNVSNLYIPVTNRSLQN